MATGAVPDRRLPRWRPAGLFRAGLAPGWPRTTRAWLSPAMASSIAPGPPKQYPGNWFRSPARTPPPDSGFDLRERKAAVGAGGGGLARTLHPRALNRRPEDRLRALAPQAVPAVNRGGDCEKQEPAHCMKTFSAERRSHPRGIGLLTRDTASSLRMGCPGLPAFAVTGAALPVAHSCGAVADLHPPSLTFLACREGCLSGNQVEYNAAAAASPADHAGRKAGCSKDCLPHAA